MSNMNTPSRKTFIHLFEEENSSNCRPHITKHTLPSMSLKNNSFTTPTRSTFRRYSLSDIRSPTITKHKSPQYNAYVSTRIDSRSPGLSTRVVQYNAEQEKSHPTHQSKYDKLGVFPVVHFFKKKLPNLERKTYDGNTQLNSAELSRFNSPEQNRMLLEKIIRSSPGNDTVNHKNEVSNTKSVLDALKEISRKRIHSNEEEFILKDDGKRMHMDYDNETTSRKRLKQNSPQIENSSSPSSRYSAISELLASQSSMDGYLVEKPKKEKPRVMDTPPVQLKSPVKTKCVNVETQTLPIEPPTNVSPTSSQKEEKENITVNDNRRETKVKKASPVKIFDETPLEAMRRNRLTALMGSFNKNKKDEVKSSENSEGLEKPLVSILTQTNKSPHKSNKHVTFDIPESQSSSSVDAVVTSSQISSSPKFVDNITKTSTVVATPIVSASVVEVSSLSKIEPSVVQPIVTTTKAESVNQASFNVPSLVSTSNSFVPLTTTSVENTTTSAFPILTQNSAKDVKEVSQSSALMFGTSKINVPATSAENEAQKGGFKFDLKQNTSTGATGLRPPFSLTTSSALEKPVEPKVVPTFGLPAMTPTTNFIVPSASKTASATTSTTPNMFTTPVITFPTNNSTASNFIPPSTSSDKPSMFSFGSTSTATSTFSQSFSSAVPTLTTIKPTKPLSFPSTNTFSLTPATTATPNGSSLMFTKPVTSFGTNSTKVSTPFNTSTPFGGNSSNIPNFGSDTKSAFGQNAAPVFGTQTPAFGATATTSSFGTAPTFGTTTTASSFGTTPSSGTTTTTSTFGTTPSSFGTPATISSFGTTTKTPSFGTTTMTPSFGTTTMTPSFGTTTMTPSFGTTTTTTTSTFGTTSAFGINSQPAGFGGNSNVGTNVFGNVATTTNNIFGGPNTFPRTATSPPFGSNSFGANQSNEVKSPPAPSFGMSNSTTFGATTSTTGFSATPAVLTTTATGFTSSFGQPNNNAFSSPFGKPSGQTSAEANPFGGTNTGFGNSSFSTNTQVTQGNVFAFGTNNSNKQPVFSFGSSEPPKPSFNFTADNSSNAFGVANKGFGNPPPAFNPGAALPFNVPAAPGAGMFNIGTGGSSTPNRSRTIHKAKRRT